MRILCLFGPPGVGKSVTCWELLNLLFERGESTSYVDLDQLGMADPEPGDEHKAEALSAIGRVHAQRGATTLLVSGVLDPDKLGLYRDALAGFDLALVRLTVDDIELRRRMDARGPYAEDWSGVRAAARRHDAAGHGLHGVRLDTSRHPRPQRVQTPSPPCRVHPFWNGNGRHARDFTDLVLLVLGEPFTWGSAGIVVQTRTRRAHIDSLVLADKGDQGALQAFART